jgi:hypothetical protein
MFPSKNLTEHGYFKYNLSTRVNNQLIYQNMTFTPTAFYLLHSCCVLEHISSASQKKCFFVVPLESSWFVSSSSTWEALFSGMPVDHVDFQYMLANNQTCQISTTTTNHIIVQLSLPIYVAFDFPDNMKHFHEVSEFSSFIVEKTPQKGIASATATTPTKKPIQKEGMCSGGTFTASDEQGGSIAEVAMVPVDSDYLNGIYQMSLLRMIYDFFLFIFALFFTYFFVVEIYMFVFVQSIQTWAKSANAQNAQYTLLYILDKLCVFGAFMLGIGLIVDGSEKATKPDYMEVSAGIFLILITFISMAFITIKKLSVVSTYPYLNGNFEIKQISNGKKVFQYIGLTTLVLAFFASMITLGFYFTLFPNLSWGLVILIILGASLLLAHLIVLLVVGNGGIPYNS